MRVKKQLSGILAYRPGVGKNQNKKMARNKNHKRISVDLRKMVILCENEKKHALMHWNEFVLDKDQFK